MKGWQTQPGCAVKCFFPPKPASEGLLPGRTIPLCRTQRKAHGAARVPKPVAYLSGWAGRFRWHSGATREYFPLDKQTSWFFNQQENGLEEGFAGRMVQLVEGLAGSRSRLRSGQPQPRNPAMVRPALTADCRNRLVLSRLLARVRP